MGRSSKTKQFGKKLLVTPVKAKTGTGKTTNDCLGKCMTKAEAFHQAWQLGMKADFSIVDEIYHSEYSSFDRSIGIWVNLDSDKTIMTTISEYIIFGPYRTIYEDSNFLLVERYARATFSEDPQYEFSVAAVSYKDNKIITQESLTEKLDYDPSEDQNWNWEDYE